MFPRDRQPERMDDPQLARAEHLHALEGLARLNRVSGISRSMYRRIRRYVPSGESSIRVLDVASGAGDIPIDCAKLAVREGLTLHTTMLDISEVAADQQQRAAQQAGVDAHSAVLDCLRQPLPSGFDVITCSLFMHHLDDHQVTHLLRSMQGAMPRAILISDLDRSRINLALVSIASRLVTRSSVVHTDAALSVRGAYTRSEFKRLAEQAFLRPIRVESTLPCRFFAAVDDQVVTVAAPAFA